MGKYSTAVRQQKIAYWKQIIIDCRKSGMTTVAYLRLHGISKSSFYYWLSKIREELLEEHPEYLHQPSPVKDARVIECNGPEESSVAEQETDHGRSETRTPAVASVPVAPAQKEPSFVSVRMGNLPSAAPLPSDKLMVSCGPFRFELTEDTPPSLLRKLAAAWRGLP